MDAHDLEAVYLPKLDVDLPGPTDGTPKRPVIVPLDGSPLAENALPWAVMLAKKWRVPLLLARVVERHRPGDWNAGLPPSIEFDGEDEAAAAYLNAKAAVLRASHPDLTVYTELGHGDPTRELLKMERVSGARLAVLTTHGRTGLSRWTRGSVAEKIAHHGTAPALLVRPWELPELREGGLATGQGGLRVVVPLDGSALSQSVLPLAMQLAQGDGGELILTSMVQTRPELAIGAYYQPRMNEQRHEARQYLDRLCSVAHAQGVAARGIVGVEHDVAGAILEFASMESADVIALTTHGRSAVGRILHGSIADRVAHAARVPVLLFRPQAAPEPAVLQEAQDARKLAAVTSG